MPVNRPPPFLLLPTAFIALCKVLRNVANSFLSAANCPRDPEEKAFPLAVHAGANVVARELGTSRLPLVHRLFQGGTILQICKYGYASTSRRRCSVLRPHVVRASLHFPCGQLRRGRRGPLPPCRIQLGIADNTDVLLLKTEAAHVHVSYVTTPGRKSNSSSASMRALSYRVSCMVPGEHFLMYVARL